MLSQNRTGVYSIANLIDGKVYIGSSSKSFRERWREHKYLLNDGTHHNRHLQGAWSKYGPSAFEFRIVEFIDDPMTILIREQYWIDACSKEGQLYNIAQDTSAPMMGRKHSREARYKNAKPYPSFRNVFTGEVIPVGTNLSELCREHGICQGNMANVIAKKLKSHKGWVLADQIGFSDNREWFGESYPSLRNLRSGEVIPAGKNLSSACHRLGIANIAKMWAVVQGDKYSYLGWILADGQREDLRAKGKPYPALINLQTSERVPPGFNLAQFCRERSLDISTLSKVIKGRHAYHKGWAVDAGQS